ncbi:MAG: flagellar biosynthetic protein FliO [Pseudomonadota bacterium]|nr:flagellar biosynthetic protein FliO [Pseudomonadota bacterium]
METLDPTRLVTVTLFLLVLLVVWYFVQRYRGSLTSKLSANRRLVMKEALALGHDRRILLIEADGKPFVVLDSRKGTSSLTPLEAPFKPEGTE